MSRNVEENQYGNVENNEESYHRKPAEINGEEMAINGENIKPRSV
jgi:hypothetical protein